MAQLAERGVRSDSGTSLRMPQGLPGEFSLPVRIDASALFGRSVYRCRRGSIPHVSGQSQHSYKLDKYNEDVDIAYELSGGNCNVILQELKKQASRLKNNPAYNCKLY